MIIFLCLVFLALSFAWPFIGGYREMKIKSDPVPLYIDMEYLKNPRYFATSFKKFFAGFLSDPALVAGVHELKLSRAEQIEVFDKGTIRPNQVFDKIFLAKGDLLTASGATFEKEVYVRGNARILSGNDLRALACNGEVKIDERTGVSRWLDADGRVFAARNCDLGISAASGKELLLAAGCRFKRLYGAPVLTVFPESAPCA